MFVSALLGGLLMSVFPLLLSFACTTEPSTEIQPPTPEKEVAVRKKTEMAKPKLPASIGSKVGPKPALGKIGGIPILPTPSILGDIDNEGVIETIKSKHAAFQACHDKELKKKKPYGKMSVYFTIDKQGAVTKARIRSTTLRHKGTEDCVIDVLSSLRFPKVSEGDKAVIIYPITLGAKL